MNQISGRLTRYQLFKGTVCTIGNKLNGLDYLADLINGKESIEYKRLVDARNNLKEALIHAIQNLTPKDFEILIDLIFRNSGWKRTSVLGEVMKFFDLVLEEPFSKRIHGAQIKSGSSFNTYKEYVNQFVCDYQDNFDSFYYAVHSPDKKLEEYKEKNEKVKLLHVKEIAYLAIDAGLVGWIMKKSE